MSRPWVAIQRNPTSGEGTGRVELLALCRRLRELGIRPRLFSKRERLTQRLEQPEARRGLVCLVAAGGDGTVQDMVNRFPGLPLTVLPLGTENLLAKYLGIPPNGRLLAETIAKGHSRTIDLGVLNGRKFTLMVTAGFDADVVHRTHSRRSGHIRKWNYLQPILESFRSYRYPELRIEQDAEGAPVAPGPALTGSLMVLANLPAYAMGLPLAGDAVGDDGLLDLRVFERPWGFQMLRYLYNVVRNQHESLPDVRGGRVRRVRIASSIPVPIQCDGDPAGWTPAEISVLPGALTLVVPPPGGTDRLEPAEKITRLS